MILRLLGEENLFYFIEENKVHISNQLKGMRKIEIAFFENFFEDSNRFFGLSVSAKKLNTPNLMNSQSMNFKLGHRKNVPKFKLSHLLIVYMIVFISEQLYKINILISI